MELCQGSVTQFSSAVQLGEQLHCGYERVCEAIILRFSARRARGAMGQPART